MRGPCSLSLSHCLVQLKYSSTVVKKWQKFHRVYHCSKKVENSKNVLFMLFSQYLRWWKVKVLVKPVMPDFCNPMNWPKIDFPSYLRYLLTMNPHPEPPHSTKISLSQLSQKPGSGSNDAERHKEFLSNKPVSTKSWKKSGACSSSLAQHRTQIL